MKWKLKALIQNILSIIPFGSHINHLLQRYVSHTFSENKLFEAYSIQVKHIMSIHERRTLRNATVLEVGPGWFSISGLIFFLLGAEKQILVDISRHLKHELVLIYAKVFLNNIDTVSRDLGVSRDVILEKMNKVMSTKNLEHYLKCIDCDYKAPLNIQNLDLPSASVDLVYSYGVLEHIPKPVLEQLFGGSIMYLKTNGRHYHNIGLHDHFHNAGLGNGVNFLRYSPWQWKLIGGNKFAYHNRLRRPDYINMILSFPYKISYQVDELLQLNIDALEKIKIHKDFLHYDKTDLAYSHLYIECERI